MESEDGDAEKLTKDDEKRKKDFQRIRDESLAADADHFNGLCANLPSPGLFANEAGMPPGVAGPKDPVVIDSDGPFDGAYSLLSLVNRCRFTYGRSVQGLKSPQQGASSREQQRADLLEVTKTALDELLNAVNQQDGIQNAHGEQVVFVSGYRSIQAQAAICASFGCPGPNKTRSVPGSSEHHLGTGVDFTTEDMNKKSDPLQQAFRDTRAFKWLRDNAHKYGFILSYPGTGTIAGDRCHLNDEAFGFDAGPDHYAPTKGEPWHWRFIGIAAATEAYDNQLCRKNYLAACSAHNPDFRIGHVRRDDASEKQTITLTCAQPS